MRRILGMICSVLVLTAVSGFGLQQDPEEIRAQVMSKEFADLLGELLKAVKVGSVTVTGKTGAGEARYSMPAAFAGVTTRQIRLPGSWSCNMSEFAYQCTWETKPNKYSVAVVHGELSTAVAAVVPKSWARHSYDEPLTRFTTFSDPSGAVAITVQCPISASSMVLRSYTVSLAIEPTNRGPVLIDAPAK